MSETSSVKESFLAAVIGKRIVAVETYGRDSMGNPADKGEVLIHTILLEDGTQIVLTGSGQIGVDDVWAEAMPGSSS
jgi:hypothetical protein